MCPDGRRVGKPQEEGMMRTTGSFLSITNQGYRTSRRKRVNLKVDATDVGRAHYRCQQQRGTCTQHYQDTLPQQYSEVVNLTGLAKKRIRRIVWKMMFVCSK